MSALQPTVTASLFARYALLERGWADNVEIRIDAKGVIQGVETGLCKPANTADYVPGIVIPGISNCHSHAFQRAMAGLAETQSSNGDFWGWRDIMYRLVARISPEDLKAIAAQLYVEMLKAGYTGVAEFHYLHHATDGSPYDDPAEMSHAVVDAAETAGIQLTLLPVLYQYGDFGHAKAGPHQRRFLHQTDTFEQLLQQLSKRYAQRDRVGLGMAFHSLRAVDETMIRQGMSALQTLPENSPIHIHISEQLREVEMCLSTTGQRPVEWLFDRAEIDPRWCFVHATHLSSDECRRLAESGAVVGLCPTTEANLGDGIFPALSYFEHCGRFALGSDSHISVNPVEEMRLLEYGQRLRHRRRNLLAEPSTPSIGASVYRKAVSGGAQSLGLATGAITPGMRADLIVLDESDPVLYQKSGDQILDTWIFASQRPVVTDVMVAGKWQVRDSRHPQEQGIKDAFFETISQLKMVV